MENATTVQTWYEEQLADYHGWKWAMAALGESSQNTWPLNYILQAIFPNKKLEIDEKNLALLQDLNKNL